MKHFTNGESPFLNHNNQSFNEGFQTEVEGIISDGYMYHGVDKLPVFEVNSSEFYQNTGNGRGKIRFTPGSKVDEYIKRSTYNRPFFIKYNGQLKKII